MEATSTPRFPTVPMPGWSCTYEMETLTGGVFVDSVGGNNAMCVGQACPTVVSSAIGYGLTLPSRSTLDLQTFTFAMWVRPALNGTFQCFLTRQFANNAANSFALCIDATGALVFRTLHGLQPVTLFSSFALTTADGFVHLAASWNGTTHRLFINGKPADSGTDAPPAIDYDNHDDTRTFLYDGQMDDLRIYDAALTMAEIRELANP